MYEDIVTVSIDVANIFTRAYVIITYINGALLTFVMDIQYTPRWIVDFVFWTIGMFRKCFNNESDYYNYIS